MAQETISRGGSGERWAFGLGAQRVAAGLLLVLFAIVLLRTAWVCDDLYITLRSVRNFVEGDGLRWNLVERVQSFTHPLWFFLLSAVYAPTRDPYYSILVLSIVLSLAAAWLLGTRVARSPATAAVGLLALSLSTAFVDYSTSGLENPLTHVLLAAFAAVFFSASRNRWRMLTLALLAGLVTLNRMDASLLVLPALLYELLRKRTLRAVSAIAVGFAPLALWEAFSLFYYGFPFPNPAYAKLNTGIAPAELLRQGAAYYLDSFGVDPLTLSVCAIAVLVAITRRSPRSLVIMAGVLAYLLYVLRIGGDFMSGRFLAAPFLLSVCVVCRAESWLSAPRLWGALAATLALGLAADNPPPLTGRAYGRVRAGLINADGIANERAFYYFRTGLLGAGRRGAAPQIAKYRLRPKRNADGVIIQHNTGLMGFFAVDRETFIVDDVALTDPLLARLPANKSWRIGHFKRAIPPGYIETVGTGRNRIVDRDLARYYDALALITRGPLWSRDRLAEIVGFNLGRRDHLLTSYLEKL